MARLPSPKGFATIILINSLFFLQGCGGLGSLLKGLPASDDKNPPVYESDDNSNHDEQANQDEVVSSTPSPFISLEIRSANIAFDLGVVRSTIGDKVIYRSASAGLIGIENQYYAAQVSIDAPASGTEVLSEAWAIASVNSDKSWMQTYCKEQQPGPNGTVIDICELAGPIIDAQKAISDLSSAITEEQLLALIKEYIPAEEFIIKATGQLSIESLGESIQQESIIMHSATD